MTACFIERGRRAALLPVALLLLVLAAAGAAAQQVGPPKPLGAPMQLGPAVAPATSPPIAAPAPPVTDDSALVVDVKPLDASGLDGVGPLDDGNGGLGPDLWRNSDRTTIERLLPTLVVPENSPVLRGLARRLLLSAAAPPKGSGSGRSFIVERAEALAGLGDADGAAMLLKLLPDKDVDAVALRLEADLAWLANDVAGGCVIAERGLARFDHEPYFAKATIFCQAQAGQRDKAMLGLDMLRDQNQADDPLFASLIDQLTGGPPAKLESAAALTPLHLAMLRAAKVGLPADTASAAPFAVIVALVRDSGTPAALRLTLAERAAAAGLVDAADLAKLYAAEPAKPAELDEVLKADQPAATPHARAVFYQATERAGDPATWAGLVQRALRQARGDGTYPLVARLYLPFLKDLAVGPASPSFALEAAIALHVTGYHEKAAGWIAQLKAAGADAKSAADRAWLVQRLGGAATPADADGLAAWYAAAKARDAAVGDAQLIRMLALFDGLGGAADRLWATLVGSPAAATMPPTDAVLWYALDAAAVDRRSGEAILLALIALGEPVVGQAGPLAIGRGLNALKRVGRGAEARNLAYEIALANGL
jgi:hypothetical protein